MVDHQAREATSKALYGYGETLRFLADRKDEAPRPGDLFLVEATADAPLEWLVVGGHWCAPTPARVARVGFREQGP